MTTNKLNTIEMTRRIRDALYEQIKDKTLPERLAFYRNKAQAVHHQLGLPAPTIPPVEPDSVRAPTADDEDH
jgi:hypothetical protein